MMKYIYLTESGVPEDFSLPNVKAGSVEHMAFLDIKALKKLRKKIKAELKSETENDNQKIVIIYSTPAAILASGLRSQIEPEHLVAQWTQQAEALVELFKTYQSNCVLANSNALKTDMSGLRKLVSMSKSQRATFDILSKGADADIYTLSAHYLIDNNDELKRQLLILDACTTFNEYSEDTCDIQGILGQQRVKEKELETQLNKSQLELEKQQSKVAVLQQGAQTLSNQVAQEKEVSSETAAKHLLEIEKFQKTITQLSKDNEIVNQAKSKYASDVEKLQNTIKQLSQGKELVTKELQSSQKNVENQLDKIKSLSVEKDTLNQKLKNTQTDLDNVSKENEQIIEQLHLVQESFEDSILKTRTLKSDTAALEDKKAELQKEVERIESYQTWLVKGLHASHQQLSKSWSYRRLMKKQVTTIKQSGLFDTAWYLETYPEVAASKINPILHYLLYGAVEGKNPSPEFNTKNYLSIYFDVAQHGMNPFIHYINFGKKEGRKADPLQKRLPSPKVG